MERRRIMKKGILICVLIAGVLVSTGCSGSRVKAPERVFEPEEAFFEIPHSSLRTAMSMRRSMILFWPWTGR